MQFVSGFLLHCVSEIANNIAIMNKIPIFAFRIETKAY